MLIDLKAAVTLFWVEQSRLPESLDELTQPSFEHGRPGGYIVEIPLDPWGEPYSLHDRGSPVTLFTVSSKGPDRREGTGDDIEIDRARVALGERLRDQEQRLRRLEERLRRLKGDAGGNGK